VQSMPRRVDGVVASADNKGAAHDAPLVLVVLNDGTEPASLVASLRSEGYAVVEAMDAVAAGRIASSVDVDVVVVDLEIAGGEGPSVLQSMRQFNATRIIGFVGHEQLDVCGAEFDDGLSDFCVKPVTDAEFRARLRLALRRERPKRPRHRREFQGLILEPSTREVVVRGLPVQLTQREFAVLDLLSATPGTVYSRQELLAKVWGSTDESPNQATVTEHVRRIRMKIEPDPHRPRWIRTVRGSGYMFERRSPPHTDD
jgi:two-component system, OmpR family, phosphate regulon response regulator PhoB